MKKNPATVLPPQDKNVRNSQRKTTIGGQALIEGLMMIGPVKRAIAIRKPDGTIFLEEMVMTRFTGAANIPFLRGSVRLFRQLVSGTGALLRSAEFVEDELEGPTGEQTENPDGEQPVKTSPRKSRLDKFFDDHKDLMLYLSAILGILFSVGLFILLPNLITSFVKQLPGLNQLAGVGATIIPNLIEGVIRICIFVCYLALASRMKDIQRVWMYHGAEHKTIACYEDRQELIVDNARLYSRFHPRCGTAFMFVVIIVSIVVFSFVGWWGRWVNLLIRFALVPLVAGIAYEIIRLAGRYDNWLTRAVAAPGLWLQRLTTAEPDDSMLEVAIAALEAVLPPASQPSSSDRW